MTDRLLTTREVAAFLGVSPKTVLRRWRAGELPGYRLASNVLRFRESEIEAWLEGTRRGNAALASVVPRSSDDRVSGIRGRHEASDHVAKMRVASGPAP
jgi:excisionase family DNA binding protein